MLLTERFSNDQRYAVIVDTYILVWFDVSIDGKQYISKGKVLRPLKTKSLCYLPTS